MLDVPRIGSKLKDKFKKIIIHTNLVVFVITVKLLFAFNISTSRRNTPERVDAIMTDNSSNFPGRSKDPLLRLFTLVLSNKGNFIDKKMFKKETNVK